MVWFDDVDFDCDWCVWLLRVVCYVSFGLRGVVYWRNGLGLAVMAGA